MLHLRVKGRATDHHERHNGRFSVVQAASGLGHVAQFARENEGKQLLFFSQVFVTQL